MKSKIAQAWACMLLFAIPCFAQKNEVAAHAIFNFNPAYFATQSGTIFAGQTTPWATAYGVSYSRALNKHNAVTILAAQGIVDAELYQGNNQFFTWSVRRYEVSTVAVQQMTHHNVTMFVFEGPGAIITRSSPRLSGTSANLALVSGFGFGVPMNDHLSWESRVSFLDSQAGCYGDKACHDAGWSVAQDLWTGLGFRW